ncbi:galactose oxidase [Periconia macrospinosa]|uniref:Galactose oxidase n=1 Tax=Periconia macrospinosa TaxID=97972 RepID=A0A2V1DYH0_9PLEO|nr:galactose oxidase [Periconia macrospinosa]
MAHYKKLIAIISLFLATVFLLFTHLETVTFVYDPRINYSKLGHWGAPQSLALIPVAGALLPHSHKVLLWAADQGDVFQGKGSDPDTTLTAIYDPKTKTITDPLLSNLRHGMFCPGVSTDFEGNLMVTGGKTAGRTSIYNEGSHSWIVGPNMTMGRGYHSQTTLSNGNTFTIGGSWSGGVGGDDVALKDGEMFDTKANAWTKLPGCTVEAILTNGELGKFESDNHAWLFAWKNASVFQAGPSRAMNWFNTHESGTTISAGARASDADAMNGNAVMYDALQGKILTVGGAPSYSLSKATRAAHIITLGAEYDSPEVEAIEKMHYPRAYSNAVILPTGDVFINGGVSYAMQWTDKNASLVPELWSPRSQKFRKLARMSIPRAYHSMALLLPDATVLTGGGGLCYTQCADLTANHMDLQIFTPPYLFTPNGKRLAVRPKIIFTNTSVELGQRLVVTTDMEVLNFSLIRYGSATHSINTDQRRIAMQPLPLGDCSSIEQGCQYEMLVPKDPGIALPGYWMLFAVDSQGVPSVGHTVHLSISSRS